MAVAGGSSSLPSDLVRGVAHSFLATNEVDHCMDLRAVCRGWRSATEDPKNTSWDPCFRPSRWIILDEVFQGGAGHARVMVNTGTGRVFHKELPLLRDYHIVATSLGGLFVLAGRSPPHAARVLDPFTGDMIRFTAPVPPGMEVAAVVSRGSPRQW